MSSMTDEQVKLDTELSLKLFIVLSRASRAVSDLVEKDIKKHGLNPSEFQVLELLYHKGEQPIQQIGKKVLLASASITYVVDKLEKKEYLYRKPCPTDRRVIFATITPEGKELVENMFPTHKEAIRGIFSNLELEEKEALIEQLKKVGHFAANQST